MISEAEKNVFGMGTRGRVVDHVGGRAVLGGLLGDYGIPGEVVDSVQGPGVVRYVVRPGRRFYFRGLEGIRSELELGMGMGGCSVGRIGTDVVVDFALGIGERGSVGSRCILFGEYGGSLGFGLGEDVMGGVVGMDLSKAPHLLVAGTTGSGKSVFLNSMICGLAMGHGSDQLRFLLIDPKGGVEFGCYGKMPHLVHGVVTDAGEAVDGLGWCVGEMERRYGILRSAGVRSIGEYNGLMLGGELGNGVPMPYIVVVADEFADLMGVRGKDLEGYVKRLAAKSRAVGIHLVLATQTPRKDVVTGELKANLPTRVCFRVSDGTDSRVMLDHNGAEVLGGRGDMVYRSSEGVETRLQGCYLSDDEREMAISLSGRVDGTGLPMKGWDAGWSYGYGSEAVVRALVGRYGVDGAVCRGVSRLSLKCYGLV